MDDGVHTTSPSSVISLVPRSVAKRKIKPPVNKVRITTPRIFPPTSGPMDTDDAGSYTNSNDSRDAAASAQLSQPALELVLSLITIHLTECLISDEFAIKLRTPQGFTDISTLLAQLQAGASYTPASVATALSKFPDLYRVKLATVKVPQSSQATRRGIQLDQSNHSYDTQIRGGGYEVQFLDGQRRARISSEDLEQKSIFLDNVPPPYASGKEGILRLLSKVAPQLIDPTIVLGIGGIVPNFTADAGGFSEGSLPMRHAVIVFDSKAHAEFALRAFSGEKASRDSETVSSLRKLGCVVRTIGELQGLRLEYLQYQARVEELLDRSVPSHEGDHVQPGHPETHCEEVFASNDQYPHHCLIFLRNLPDSTNKTEIKAKLDVYLDGDKVDYVDWKKGQITAYVRVLRPMHASKIIEGLSKEGKDDTMKAELLADKQEEIYWMKLPEKIRVTALSVSQ